EFSYSSKLIFGAETKLRNPPYT
ncbi:mCG146553, partial [Mus musculus]